MSPLTDHAGKPRRGARAIRRLFTTLWFVVAPAVIAVGAVWVFRAGEHTSRDGILGSLAWLIREQPVPAGIVLFMIAEAVLYRFRHSLPGASRVGVAGRRDVPKDFRTRFEAAQGLIEETDRIMRKKRRAIEARLSPEGQEALEGALDTLQRSMAQRPFSRRRFDAAVSDAQGAVDTHLGEWRKGSAREYGEAIIIAIAIAAALRIFVFEPFRIPTGSMLPTLELQDHIFVNKLAYGLQIPWSGKRLFSSLPPERGDVIVFRYPMNRSQDFVKRVVGEAGDVISVRNGHPVINGWPVPSCEVGSFTYEAGEQFPVKGQLFVEFLGDATYFTVYRHGSRAARTPVWPPTGQPAFKVQSGEAFVLGDNRLNSMDSREWFGGRGGGVPYDDIKGKALFVWLRFNQDGQWLWQEMFTSVMSLPELPESSSAELRERLKHCLGPGRPENTWPPKSAQAQ